MTSATLPSARGDVQSFRVAQPLVDASSRFEVAVFAALVLVAAALWLAVIPLELLRHALPLHVLGA